jgi:hypothetical protein
MGVVRKHFRVSGGLCRRSRRGRFIGRKLSGKFIRRNLRHGDKISGSDAGSRSDASERGHDTAFTSSKPGSEQR